MGRVSSAIPKSVLTTIGDMIAASAVGTPSRIAAPAAGQVLTGQGAGVLPAWAAAGGGAVTREGGNTTEATTTSTGAVDLLTATGLSVAAALPVLSHFGVRKTTGAAAAVQAGVKINATQIIANAARANAADAAQAGYIEFTMYGRVTLYNGTRNVQAIQSSGEAGEVFFNGITTAPPIASTTDVVVTGLTNSASVTLGADELQVYTYTAS